MSKNDDLVRRWGHIVFLREAAKYFENRPTNGEDKAHWSNVYNAKNCREIADAIERGTAQGTDFREMFGDHAVYAHLAAHLLRIAKTFKEGALRVGIEMAATEIAAIADEMADDGGDQLQTLIEQMIGLLDGSYALVETDPTTTPPAPAPDARPGAASGSMRGERQAMSVPNAGEKCGCDGYTDDGCHRCEPHRHPTPQPPAVEVDAVERYSLSYIETTIGEFTRLMMPTAGGAWVRFTDHEAAIKAKTDEIERLTKLKDFLGDRRLANHRRAEAAEASNKALREKVEQAIEIYQDDEADDIPLAMFDVLYRALLPEKGGK